MSLGSTPIEKKATMVSEICSPGPDSQGKIITRIGVVRDLPPNDPRSIDHPFHAERWIELAGVLGRAMADYDFDRLHNTEGNDENRRRVCEILKPDAKGTIN